MELLRVTAKALGFDFENLADSYATFLGNAKGSALEGDPARGMFLNFSLGAKAMKLDSESIKGSLRAISQMISKGKITAVITSYSIHYTKLYEDVMRKDPEVLALLNMQTRGTVANLDLGPRTGEVSQFVGHVAPNLPVYVYSDYYHDAAGNVTPFMDPKAVVLTSSRYEGTRAFGAILDP